MPKNKKQIDMLKTMLMVGAGGLLVIIIAAVITFNFLMGDHDSTKNGDDTQDHQEQEDEDDNISYVRALAVIESISKGSNEITIFNVEKKEKETVTIDGTVELKDRYGQAMTFEQFRIGDMISTKYDPETKIPVSFRLATETWEHEDITEVKIDTQNKTIEKGSDRYEYDEHIVVHANGEPIDLQDITKEDTVTIKGYKSTVYSIELEGGHGYLTINSNDQFAEATVDIDNHITLPIEEVEKIPLPEGVHKIVVNHSGFEPVVKEVMIQSEEETRISLDDVQSKTGMVQFVINEEDVELYVNGEKKTKYDEPISLPYGEYDILAKKENRLDWEKKITVDQAYVVCTITMEKPTKFVHIDSRPTGAEIYIDGNFIGYAPVSRPIDPGKYTILLSKQGYNSRQYTIEIMENQEDAYFTFPALTPIHDTVQPDDSDDDESGAENNDNPSNETGTPGSSVYNR